MLRLEKKAQEHWAAFVSRQVIHDTLWVLWLTCAGHLQKAVLNVLAANLVSSAALRPTLVEWNQVQP